MRQIPHLLSTGLTIGRLTNVSGQGASSAHPVARRLRRLGWVGALLIALLALAPVLGQTLTIYAANEPAVQTFFVPLPEDQVRTSFLQIYSGTGATMHGVIGVSITVNNTIIYYDQWENGYDTDIANPTNLYSAGNLGGTQIWGDGNAANGAPPGVPSDILNAGTVISLENDIAIPRNPATILFDGRDKLSSSKVVAVTKSAWALTPGTVLADAIEVNDTTRWGKSFKMPIGQDLSSSSMFEYTSLLVMASENGTVVQIDTDGNGTVDLTQTLSQGQSYQVNGGIKSNATVTSSKPIQVDLITGDVGSTYENRWFSIPPTVQWGSSYYTPVGTTSTSYPANVWLYNPNASAITVNYETKSGTGTVNVTAGATARFAMPSLSGAHFFTTNSAVFAALGTMDSSVSGADQTFDWGYTLVPESYLTSAFAVGWAPGTSDLSGNGSPVWVTAVKPTTIYVDYDGDPSTGSLTDSSGKKYNVAFTLTALESKQIYDPDKNQTGMRVYTLDGTLITGAWGEDPSKAQAGNPYMDVGYTIPPLPQVVLEKTGHVANDSNSNGELDPSETLGYTITAKNLGVATFFNTIISDTVPTNVTYVPNSTKFNGTPVADNTGPATAFPLDEGGLNVGNILVGGSIKVTFEALANAFPPVYSNIGNTATAYVGGEAFLIKVNTPVNTGTITQCTVDFTNAGGTAATIYLENGTVYVQVNDADQNANTSAAETVSVNLVNSNTSDVEALTLTETGVNTGIFRGNMPSSITAGQTSGDGTLYAKAGDSVAATYTDPTFGDTCSDTVAFSLPSQTKVLYLSDPSQALDRIDPVATGDSSTASSVALGSSSGTVTVDGAPSTSLIASATSRTFSHTSGSGTNRLLLVGVSTECTGASCATSADPTVTSVTFNGQSLTFVGRAFANGNDALIEIWRMFNPPASTTANVVVTLSGSTSLPIVAGAINFAGVDQAQTLTFANANGNNSTPQVTVASVAGGMVFETTSFDDIPTGSTASTAGSGQTERWSGDAGTNGSNAGARGLASTKAGAAPNVTMSWSTSSGNWAMGAVSISPASTIGATSTAFTQTLSMASNLVMPVGGMITVTNYISVTSGTPVAPVEITATLKYGSNTFANLTTPTMTSLGSGIYKLVWTGVLASNTTVPTGQQIFLTLKTSEPGVALKFFYDSATYPSRVQLPTTTVIDVTSLGIYDAPYPGGTLLTGAANGQTVYVRAAVSDPFGASDITTSTVTLTDPNNTPSTVTLSGGNLVASTTGSKTFEYVWNTSVVQGIYNVQVTSHEGYEAITDSASTPFNLSYQDTGTPSTSEFTTGSNGPAASLYSPNSSICVRVTDVDQNANPALAETITATISSASGDSETVTLTETGLDTGVFVACIPSSNSVAGSSDNGTLYALAGSVLNVRYVDPNDASDVSGATATISTPTPALSLSKVQVEPADGIAVIGDSVRFDIAIVNPGPTPLLTVVLTDTFPASCLSYQSASVTPSSVVTPTISWSNVGPIASGASKTISLYFLATAACSPATNSVAASGVDNDSAHVSAGPATADVTTTRPGLSVTKTLVTPASGSPEIGDPVVFHIALANTGSTAITNLPLSDNYSSGCLAYVSADPPATAAGGGAVLWSNLGPLPTSQSTTVDVTFEVVGACDPTENVADVSAATDANGDAVPAAQGSASLTTVSASIGDLIWDDSDGNGVQAVGELGLPGVVLSLTLPGGAVLTTTTDVSGTYSFDSLASGNYTVTVNTNTLPANYFLTTSNQPLPVILTAGQVMTTADFGYRAGGAVTGHIFEDTDGNGAQDGGEPGLLGITVVITDSLGLTHTVTTDANGDYTATVPAGLTTADVDETTLPVGYVHTAGEDPNEATVPSGGSISAGDNGYQPQGDVTGHVFEDTNGNGTQDGVEPDLPSVTVVITDSVGVTHTATTDANGDYTTTVPAGSTTADVDETTLPAGYVQTAGDDPSTVTALTGSTVSIGNDGYQPQGEVIGHVFEDTDGNGTQGKSEPDLPSITVVITDSLGVTHTVSTDANGNYTATVPAGSTTADVDETTLPAGYVQTAGDDPSTVTVTAGNTTSIGNDGYQPQGDVTGHVFEDTDGNGTQGKSEPDLPSVTVVITDSLGVTHTVSTDANGNYTATVPAGLTTADVDETTLPAGYAQTAGDDPSTVTVTAGNTTSIGNDGYQPQGLVTGHVFEDTNGNGTQDGVEPDLPSITVVITDSLGVTHTATTDTNGNYTTTVPAGSTTADVDEATLPAGYVQTAGDDPSTVTVTAGNTTSIGNDGYQPQGDVTGHVFEDTDGNGTQGKSEPDLPSITVVITDSLGMTYTVSTDANGNYTATVPTGSTTADVDEATLPAGYVQTAGDDPSTVTATAGNTTSIGNDGYQPQGDVIGHVFEDTDGNGTQGKSEPDLPSITVIITDSLGVTHTVSTDANGNYTATVPAGSTTADVDEATLSAGYVQTAGDDPSTVTALTGSTVSIGNDGYQPQGDVIGHVFEDTDGNGIQGKSEPDLPSITVVITDSLGVTHTVSTDANGNYTATVPAGSTTADVDETTLPAGYVQTAGDDPSTVTATAGNTTSIGNDGYQPQGDVTGHVFEDTDGNGTQGKSEPDLPSITVVITDSLGVTHTVSTDANGNYTATVPAGSTTADVDEATLPAGYVQTAGDDPSTVTATAGNITSIGNDGYQPQSAVTGHIFEDTNGNGTQDEGEPNLSGIHVVITDSLGATQTVTTLANGNYVAIVPAGSTTADVDETTLPAGYVQTAGDDPSTVTVPSGTPVSIGNDGYQPQGLVNGHLFVDTNGNGAQGQSEPNLPNVTVVLTDSLGMTYTMTSDANGNYTTTVPAGSTTADVDESTLPGGYVQTAGSDPSTVIALAGKMTSVGNDGYQPQGAVRGHVFKDTNGNATQNENEPDLPGVRIVITDSLSMTQTATTDAHGNYTVTVPAGTTKVDVDETTLPVGSVRTAGNDPNTVTVPTGTVTSAGNAGYQPQGIISGHIYKDSNGNGQQDEGEPNLPDVMIIITDSLGITHVVTTDRAGTYQLGVPVGLTTADIVESSLPAGLIQSAGSDPMIVDVLPGQKILIVSDGYTLAHTASLGGFLWIDVNGNGKQDPSEMNQPLVGSVVSLFLADSVNSATAQESNPLAVQTTGNDGRYLFTNLQSGNYVVQIVPPTGYISTQGGADPNNDDDTDSNGVPVGNAVRSLPVTLQTGTEPTSDGDTDADTNLTVDFGFYLFARMGDYVWSDTNGNGIQDTDETGIANVTITLYSNVPSELIPNGGQTTKVALMKSDTQGHYQFDQLAPGAYIVEFTPPADYTASPMHRGGNDANDSDVDASTDFRTLPITLRSGEYNATLDAGLIQVPTGLHPNPEPAAPGQSRIFLPLINR